MHLHTLFVAALIWSATCAADYKIAVIDLPRAIFQTADGKAAKGQFDSELKKRQAVL